MCRLIIIIVASFVLYCPQTSARICKDVFVNSRIADVQNQLAGCTVVVGYLKLVLMEYEPMHDHHNITFPELREITGNLLLYRVYGLTSIGKLFPNLSIIRGDILSIADYALIVYDMPDLKEIGLTTICRIGGSIRIERCPHLCFVNTVDWSEIAPRGRLEYFDSNSGDCTSCLGHCNGTCWNEDNCQILNEQCHPECIGCYGPAPTQCYGCKNYWDSGVCVSMCPQEKFRNFEARTCVTEEECTSNTTEWWIFQRECISKCPYDYIYNLKIEGRCEYCGDYCKKICRGGDIYNIPSAKLFYNCTHIDGYLDISVTTQELAHFLKKSLAKIEEITEHLIIIQSTVLNSLAFMKNLKVISGHQLYSNKYALVISGNRNLYELWNWDNFTLKIERGGVLIYDNSHLCGSEINRLILATGLSHHSANDAFLDSNGYETVCTRVDLKFELAQVTSTTAKIAWDKYTDSLGYTIYYTEDPFRNKTIYDGKTECSDSGWMSVFKRDNTVLLKKLLSYKQYAFYIDVYVSSLSLFNFGRSGIQYFTTLTDEPSEPQNIRVDSTNSSSITITWEPPEFPNGILSYYLLTSYLQEENQNFELQRNYCSYPFQISPAGLDKETPLETWTNSTCCNKQNWTEWGENRLKRSFMNENELIIPVNLTTYTLTSLQYFKIYILTLRACNADHSCSAPIMFFQRTMPKEGADDIPPGISTVVSEYTAFVTWLEPVEPNSVITSYILEYQRMDLEESVPSFLCITRKDYKESGNRYTIKTIPGRYLVKVTAVSLAGPGKSSEVVTFEIAKPITSENFTPIYLVVAIIISAFIASGIMYSYCNKRKGWILFTNTGSAESIYLNLNQYILERNEVHLFNETCQDMYGYGAICNGFIISQNRPCTIKLGKSYCNLQNLVDTFNDLSTLKLSNESYHIVSIIGIVPEVHPPLIITELMACGDLKSFLRRTKENSNITYTEIYRMASEIADGMTYLAFKRIVHSDLATRNCMVSAGYTVKIVNFDIGKDLYEGDYCNDGSNGLIPVRWMAPESLADGVVTIKSNVWSYGIILCELVTFAEQPYPNLSDQEVSRYVIGKNIMECPAQCSDLLYEMMVACWRWRPAHRPHFTGLLKQLQSQVQRDFKLVSFYHSREGMKYRKSLRNIQQKTPLMEEADLKSGVHWKVSDEDVHLPILNDYKTCNLPSTSAL